MPKGISLYQEFWKELEDRLNYLCTFGGNEPEARRMLKEMNKAKERILDKKKRRRTTKRNV